MRKRHPNKEIEKAIAFAETHGWYCKPGGNSSRSWGCLYCPAEQDGCIVAVWSTPRDPAEHAKQLRAKVRGCPKKHK